MSTRRVMRSLLIAGVGLAAAAPAAQAARPAIGSYSTQAVGQASPHILIGVGREHRIGLITLERLRCMTGRLDAMIGIHQRGGVFSLTRRSGAFKVGTGTMLVGTDYRIRGRFTTPGTATGQARLISIRRLGGRRCDSGWVRFRVAPMNPIDFGSGLPLTTDLALPGTALAQIEVVNTARAASKSNRVRVTLRATPSYATQLGVPSAPVITTDRGTCAAASWRGSAELEAAAACDLGGLPAGGRATITVSSAWPTPPLCDGGADLTVEATMERATLNDDIAQGVGTTFRLMCSRLPSADTGGRRAGSAPPTL